MKLSCLNLLRAAARCQLETRDFVLPITLFVVSLHSSECLVAGQSAARSSLAAQTNKTSVGKPAKTPIPRHDPADQLFRRAPMAESSRSIAIALATNLHVAFDAQLLRTHTAWAGPSLNLFGPPYHGGKSPFLCTYEGAVLWTTPPFCPWAAKIPPAENQRELAAGSDFKGISTKGGVVTLLYDLAIGDGETVRIHESPRQQSIASVQAVVRRFEISSCAQELWCLAHAEMGKVSQATPDEAAVQIERDDGVLVAVVRGLPGAKWTTEEKTVAYEAGINVEKKGESEIEKIQVRGMQARAYLRVPSHRTGVAVEIASAVCRDAGEAKRLIAELAKTPVAGPQMDFISSSAKDSPAPSPKIVAGDPTISKRSSGDEYYRIEHFPLPKEIELLVTGLDRFPNGDLAVCTWPGEIYIVEHADGDPAAARYRRFARGLNEPLGLKILNEQIYVVQKCDLTRVVDTDGNGEADLYETITDDWGYSGNYHAFAFGPVVDKKKNFYAFLCGQHGRWDIPYVGWCVEIRPDGSGLEGYCSGLRAPNGFGLYGPDNDLFMADNQGNWIGACKLNHLKRGRFYGYPSGLPAPEAEYAAPKTFQPPAVWFPRKLSPSTSGFVTVDDERLGPFQGQMLIGDFQNAVVLRVFLEKVNGDWQGAVWPFAKGFLSGVNRLALGRDGKLYVGGLKNAAWAASAPKDYSLDRVSFTGKTPFEVKEVRATSRGFDLTFTLPVEPTAAANPDNYDVAQYTYLYHQTYGSPEIDHDGKKDSSTSIKVVKADVSADGQKVQLTLEGWKPGYVTMVRCFDLKSAAGQPIWHDTFYYTLNNIPK